MISPVILALTVLLPGLAVLAALSGRTGERWPWPQGLVVALSVGTAVAGMIGVVLGLAALFSLPRVFAGALLVSAVSLGAARRLAWPFAPAPRRVAAAALLVGTLSGAVFLGRPFEMLLGGRDATVYIASGIALSREGSLALHRKAAPQLSPAQLSSSSFRGFAPLGDSDGTVAGQGLDLFPALVALAHAALGLDGALSATGVVAVLSALGVWAAGTVLVGAGPAVLGASLLVLDFAEVWAARYPAAEILLQLLFFGSAASLLGPRRSGEIVAAILLGAVAFTKVEGSLVWLPLALAFVGRRLGAKGLPDRPFWVVAVALSLFGSATALWLHRVYVQTAAFYFLRFLGRSIPAGRRLGAGVATGIGVLVLCAMVLGVWIASYRLARRWGAVTIARASAVVIPALTFYGWAVRPLVVMHAGAQTLVWLARYVGPGLLAVSIVGFSIRVWRERDPRRLLVLGLLLVHPVVFLVFPFVELRHPYLSRRFVPATLPLVFLFAAAAIEDLVRVARGGAGRGLGAVLIMAALASVIERSRTIYTHREYPGLAGALARLARDLAGADLVILGDAFVRDGFGPALEWVYGLPVVAAAPERVAGVSLERAEQGGRVVLVQLRPPPVLAGSVQWDPVARRRIELRFLESVAGGIPRTVRSMTVEPRIYELGLVHRLEGLVCPRGRRLGGNRFLVQRLEARCAPREGGPFAVVSPRFEASSWAAWLEAHGARFDRRDLPGVVLFDRVEPRRALGHGALPTGGWRVEATDGGTSAGLAVDGRLETRFGSGRPRRPGMVLTLAFPSAVDITWARIRLGRFETDGARKLMIETSRDGRIWQGKQVPWPGGVWRDGVLRVSISGEHDLWIDERDVRFLRLTNLDRSEVFDWSVAELVLEGRTSDRRREE